MYYFLEWLFLVVNWLVSCKVWRQSLTCADIYERNDMQIGIYIFLIIKIYNREWWDLNTNKRHYQCFLWFAWVCFVCWCFCSFILNLLYRNLRLVSLFKMWLLIKLGDLFVRKMIIDRVWKYKLWEG